MGFYFEMEQRKCISFYLVVICVHKNQTKVFNTVLIVHIEQFENFLYDKAFKYKK